MGKINNLILASGLMEETGFGSKSYATEVYVVIAILAFVGLLLFGAMVIYKNPDANGKTRLFHYEYAIPISVCSAFMMDAIRIPFINSEMIMYGLLLVTLIVSIVKLGVKMGIAIYSWQFLFGFLIGFTAIISIIVYLALVILIVGLKKYFAKKNATKENENNLTKSK